MPISQGSVAVTATATIIYTAGARSLDDPIPIVVQNNGATTVYLGGASVTAGSGVRVASTGGTIQLVLGPNDTLYGISGGTETVNYLVGRV